MGLNPGTKLGPYEIQTSLGAGGMGEVYRAFDARLHRNVAIKILPASFSSDPERLQRFTQESRATAALNHPNILAIHDIGDDRGTPYVVCELLEGETLRDRLRAGPLSSRKAIEYAQQIARGLAAAHEKNIVHRDLKPENIFLTNDGGAKILDFGLAKVTRPGAELSADAPTMQVATEAGTVLGTVGYMSPEQVRGKAADQRSDIFAFGAILYEMLSGKRAFHGDSAADTMSAILKEEPPDLFETNRNVLPALESIVRHCLEKNPAERFQSARDVGFSLEAISDTSVSSRGSMNSIPPEKATRHWLAPVLAGLVLLAVGAGVGRYAWRGAAANPTFHEITFRNGTIWGARFAPDAQTIVYGAAWEGQPQELFSTRFDSTDSRSMGLPPGQILSISSSGEMAICLRPTPYTHHIQSGTLARVPLAGGAPREVLENVAWADWARDGQSLAIVRRGKSDLNHLGSLEYPVGHVIYEPNGWVSDVRFSPSGEFLAIADHILTGNDGRIVILDRQGNRKVSSSFYPALRGLAWSANGKEVWFTASPGASSLALYALDFSGKERLVYSPPEDLTIHDISRSGLVLVTADKFRMGIYALAPGETHERSLSWFDWSYIADISSDGKTILFSETGRAVGTNYSIYLRGTDGSPAVRLGEGSNGALSPDGKWVIAEVGSPAKLMLLPTGVGETRQLTDDKIDHFGAAWLPDSKSVMYNAAEPGHGRRSYVLDIESGTSRPITIEDTVGWTVTPDGKSVAAVDAQRQRWFYPIAGGEPQKFSPNVKFEESVRHFMPDGKSVLAITHDVPAKVTHVDIATGRRDRWMEIMPADPAGAQSIADVKFSADGKSYAYSVVRLLSDLYVVDGLR
ncbi:MAG TPA: WD40 repeat domain-containing serine/threonine protein kinase [Terriglobales bacterium]|nr:WD40 repeat domain-containing serine/threonine protein kinase [Terriglobales bacterium]